jgi:hypothetical protein
MASRKYSSNDDGLLAMDFSPPSSADTTPDFGFLNPLKPTVVFSTYWRFAVERQEVYFRRVCGAQLPWSLDPVLRIHKFTNAYRAADRVSQYLIRHVIGEDFRPAEDTFFRILLFKLFNRIETWELIVEHLGQPSAREFDVERYDRILSKAFERGERLYSAAYIMPSGGKSGFSRKHTMHLHLLKQMLQEKLPARIAEAGSMERAFGLLRACPTIGDFLAYQFVTDLNYSRLTDFKEDEFVVPGPGAKGGIEKCFSDLGGMSEADVIRLVTERQEDCLRALGLQFPTLWGRRLQLIDCQNLFCEVNKYARVAHPEFCDKAGRTRIKQKLRPKDELPIPLFPAKWGINDLLLNPPAYVPSP